MFPTNINLFIAFHGQDSIKMVSRPENQLKSSLTWGEFFYNAILPYQLMIYNPVYPKKLRNKLRAHLSYTRSLSMFFQLELQHGRDDQGYRDKIAQMLQTMEQISQELDKSIQ